MRGRETERLAGPLLFTTTTTPGQAMDRHLHVDRQGPELGRVRPRSGLVRQHVLPDANGYDTVSAEPNYDEWCADHDKPLEKNPFGVSAAAAR